MNRLRRPTQFSFIRRMGALLVGLLLIGHFFQWELSQAGAWSFMLAEFSQTQSLTDSIRDTLSGEKPCSMCKSLTRERVASPDDRSFTRPVPPRQDLYPPSSMRIPSPTHRLFVYIPDSIRFRDFFSPEPPVPPPRPFSC